MDIPPSSPDLPPSSSDFPASSSTLPTGAGLVEVEPSKEAKLWAMVAHLGTFSGHLIPFGHIIAPLVVWAMKKDEHPLVDDQGKESLNFQITMSIYFLLSLPLWLVLIGVPITIGLWIFDVVMVIIAGIKANEGVRYRYPGTIRFVK